MYELRGYQKEASEAVRKEWAEGHGKTLLVLPTGTGKTVVFGDIADKEAKKGKRVLVLAHRDELLEQASSKMMEGFGVMTALEKAGSTAVWSNAPVVVGSVQTMAIEKRLNAYPRDWFGSIIVDEAHHATSDSYQKVLSHFGSANVLGVTATPDRGDKRSLAKYFQSIAYEYTLPRAVREGYLCPITARMIPLELDIKGVRVTSGDYSEGQIGLAIEPYLEEIASKMEECCKGRKTVVFLPLVRISKAFRDILERHGFRAAEVNGQSEDRKEVLEGFRDGRYDVICNSMLLTEGWDCPSVDCIVILRPTKQRSLYQQMVGRGMRPSEGKRDLLLLDFLWLTERHDLCRPSCLASPTEEVAGKVDAMVSGSSGGVDLLGSCERAERDVLREKEEALQNELRERRNRKEKLVDPIQFAFSIDAEDLASYEPTFAWEGEPPTERQLAFLSSSGINPDEVPSKGYATMLIDRLIARRREGLSTAKQIRLLERRGFLRVGTWTFEQASQTIDWIAGNGWRLPYGFNPSSYVPGGSPR